MQKELFELLCSLVREKAVTADAEAVNRSEKRVEEYLKSRGFLCAVEEVGPRKVLFASTVPGKTPDYLLNAHLDVVPGLPEQYEPVLKDSVLYGRGVNDCLGNAMVMIRVLELLKDTGLSCGAIFTGDEEKGGETSAAMVERGYGAKKGVIVLDSAYGKVTYGEKGILAVQLTARSKTGGGHASRPWQFENPIDKLIDGYVNLRKNWRNPDAKDEWGDSMAATLFHAGSVRNQISDEASMELNIRYTDEGNREEILRKVEKFTGCECRVMESCPPAVTDPDTPMLQQLQKFLGKHITDRRITFARMNGATDARHFVKLGVPVAMLGADGSGAHAAKEYLRIDSVEVMAQTLADFMRNAE